MLAATTIILSKSTAWISRLLGRGSGQALPGLVADRLDPQLAGKLASRLPNGVILVTGTNGKTTTTKLLASMLSAAGEQVLVNKTGSNLRRGIVSALLGATSVSGKISATVGIFEVDEASLRKVAGELAPKHIVILNLFRDQLDRYGELDTTAAVIGEGIAQTRAKLHLNADDPLVASLSKYASQGADVSYFGVEGLPAAKSNIDKTAIDSDRCPICNTLLVYSRIFYGHIGHYKCPKGHFTRPRPKVVLTNVDSADLDGSDITVSIGGKRISAKYPLPGTYNIYNALAAASAAIGFGVSGEVIASQLSSAEAAYGRVESVNLRGRKVYLLLIKNPAGFSQVIETFLVGRKNPDVLIAINDLAADGRDVSWLWDAPIELMRESKPQVATAGIRGADMALRLHYADVQSQNFTSLSQALAEFLTEGHKEEPAFILPTYTAMIQVRKELAKTTKIGEI